MPHLPSLTGHSAPDTAALLQVYCELHDEDPPPCTMLAVRGVRFELGEPPSAAARGHVDCSLQWARSWLARPLIC